MRRRRFTMLLALASLILACSAAPAHARTGVGSAEQSCLAKARRMQQNADQAKPDQTPTVFSESEVNACFASDQVKLQPGLSDLRFHFLPGHVSAQMKVDFDQLAKRSSSPLLGLFSGTHLVQVQAHGGGSGGVARAHIDSVSLDGSEVPRFLLSLFVAKMLQPKYPQASLDPTFQMPYKVDLAILGTHKITLTQK